jgi:hypothetical protein
VLVTWAAAMSPITLPEVIRGTYGVDPDSAEFRERFLPQLQRLFRPRDIRLPDRNTHAYQTGPFGHAENRRAPFRPA